MRERTKKALWQHRIPPGHIALTYYLFVRCALLSQGQQGNVFQTQPTEALWWQHHLHQLHPQTGKTAPVGLGPDRWAGFPPRLYHAKHWPRRRWNANMLVTHPQRARHINVWMCRWAHSRGETLRSALPPGGGLQYSWFPLQADQGYCWCWSAVCSCCWDDSRLRRAS